MLTTTEAALELGISRSRVLHLIADGRIKATRFGNTWAIWPEDLDAVRIRKSGWPKGKPRLTGRSTP